MNNIRNELKDKQSGCEADTEKSNTEETSSRTGEKEMKDFT